MVQIEKPIKPREVGPEDEALAMEAIRTWAAEHTDDLISLLPYDPNRYPHQRLDIIHIPANSTPENLLMAGNLAAEAMGSGNYAKLLSDFETSGAKDMILSRTSENQNTLVVSGHLNDTLDTALSHNLLMASVDEQRQADFASRNVVLANHIMKFMAIGEYPVTEILSWSGDVLVGMPPAGALRHGVPRNAVRADFANVEPVFDQMLEKGVALHRALTGTRAKNVGLADGRDAKYLPELDQRIFKTIFERINCAVVVPLVVKIGDTRGAVYPPVNLAEPQDVHDFMHGFAEELANYSGSPVFYGKPEGSSDI